MTSFATTRAIGWILFLLFSGAAIWLHRQYSGAIPGFTYLSGWALLFIILILTLYNGRKKLPFLPLFTSQGWLQFHIYAGMLTGVVFVIHLNYRMPTGWFEGVLSWLYLLVMGSGFFGLFISRRIPKRLTTRGGEVLYERIPAIRKSLEEKARNLALTSVPEMKSTVIADFYVRELKDFFDGPRNFTRHWLEIRSPLNRLMNKIGDLSRYLNEKERQTMEQIAALVRQKDGLDYHGALQGMLKIWLFAHIPLTYSLLLFTAAHIVIVFAFSGGVK